VFLNSILGVLKLLLREADQRIWDPRSLFREPLKLPIQAIRQISTITSIVIPFQVLRLQLAKHFSLIWLSERREDVEIASLLSLESTNGDTSWKGCHEFYMVH